MEPEICNLFIAILVACLLHPTVETMHSVRSPPMLRSRPGTKDAHTHGNDFRFNTPGSSCVSGSQTGHTHDDETSTRGSGLGTPGRGLPEAAKTRQQRSAFEGQKPGWVSESTPLDDADSWVTMDKDDEAAGSSAGEKESRKSRMHEAVFAWVAGASAVDDGSNPESTSVEEFMMALPTISSSEVPDFCCSEEAWATRDTTEYEFSSREVIPDDEEVVTQTKDSRAKDSFGQMVRQGAEEEDTEPEGVLYIGGIFELTNNPHSANPRSELEAALLAIRHVNEQRLVPGYRLTLVYNDSKCDPGVGTDVFYDMIYRMPAGRRITTVMGSSCTEVSKTLAEITPYWNLVLISYGETSPALGDREKYQTFFRLALADSALVPARRMFIKNFGWKTVAVLYEDTEIFSLAMNDIGADLGLHNISVAASLSFKDAAVEIPEKLLEIKELDLRIIIAALAESTARQVFCEAYRQGLTGPRYVWLLAGSFGYRWWLEAHGTGCTVDQLTTALNGCFAVGSLNTLLGGETSVANLTTAEFMQAYINNNGSNPMSFFAATTYDTVWTIALMLQAVITRRRHSNRSLTPLHEMSYSDLEEIRGLCLDVIENMHFLGVSGPVSFKGSDREGISVIYQLQDGNSSRVAIHYPGANELDFNCDECYQIVWQGGRIPRDGKTEVTRQRTIESSIFYTSAACCGAGIVLALAFLQYNLYHRKLKFIKLSSPTLNNVAVIGCIFVYATVVLMGLDDRIMPPDVFGVVCTVRVFLLAAGFSLAFGAMFAKTFRVHQIFTRAHHGLVKSKLLKDRHLLFIIGGLLMVDSGVIFVWVILDPMHRHVTNLTKESSEEDEDLVFLTQLATCHSEHLQKWMGVFYAYKGLLLLFGVYMAWETRHVKIPALNDSQYIGFNVYNVVLMSVCVVVLSNILSSRPTLAYAIESAFMVLSTTVTLCLLFVPKIYVIVTSGGEPVIASTGILVEANTRRFVIDEKKEMYYRAEVQNRVYKREVVELDQEISRLERLLELSVESFPRLTEDLMYLLPESKVDGTPPFQRRRKNELERCGSISDGGEGVSYDDEETHDVLAEMGLAKVSTHPPFVKRHSAAHAHEHVSAFKKLRRLSRSLSIGHASNFRWKHHHRSACRHVGTDPPSNSDNHAWLPACSTGGTQDLGSGDDDGGSMTCPSLPLSPAAVDDVPPARSPRSSGFSSETRRDDQERGVEMRLTRRRSDGRRRQEDEEEREADESGAAARTTSVRTEDKVTQTADPGNPLEAAKRAGTVYHVRKLEVIPLADSRPDDDDNDNDKDNEDDGDATSGRANGDNRVEASGDEDSYLAVRPHIRAERCSSSASSELPAGRLEVDVLSASPGSPSERSTLSGDAALVKSKCLKKGAVHFASDNEIRFLDASRTRDHAPNARDITSSVSDEILTPTSHNGSTVASRALRGRPEPDDSYTPENEGRQRDVESAVLKNNSLSMLRSAKTLIEQERRKRIRKLQSDLVKIQKELQDLDNLEYEVSEV